MHTTPQFSAGDIFYLHSGGQYHVFKVLEVDHASQCCHVMSFSPLQQPPDLSDVMHLSVFIYHSPFDIQAFHEAVLLGNQPVTASDLRGYHEYLRQTQLPDYCVSVALQYYHAGIELTDSGKHTDAIDAYSKAIDLVPAFFEAIDKRAFCKMDLGMWNEAIDDFNLSLKQNPGTLLAEFSIGECYFRLGEYNKAKEKFEIAHAIDPNHPAPVQFLKKVNEKLNN